MFVELMSLPVTSRSLFSISLDDFVGVRESIYVHTSPSEFHNGRDAIVVAVVSRVVIVSSFTSRRGKARGKDGRHAKRMLASSTNGSSTGVRLRPVLFFT